MVTVSLCMIVRDEEGYLGRCLDSALGLFDELIIVDTGSGDATPEIALRYGARLLHFTWCDDFAAARNFAFDAATMDYCLWLDADDVILPRDREAFIRLRETLPPNTDVVMLPYICPDSEGRPLLRYYRERLIRRRAGLRWQGAVHEAIPPAGRIIWADAAVTHMKSGPGEPDRNLRIYENLLARGQVLAPRERFYYARELAAAGREQEARTQFREFLSLPDALPANRRQAVLDLAASYERTGNIDESFSALCLGLRMGEPWAELCCELGRLLLEFNEPRAAVFWYERALCCPPDSGFGFELPDCRGYIPLMQLCLAWHRLGDNRKASEYNEKAAKLYPNSPACQQNREYFAGKISPP